MKKVLMGIAASPGIAKGKVKIVTGIEDTPSFREGSVLVTQVTDPTMIVMMGKASAIVCDHGGITSHPAILSREMGIPCVVNTLHATTTLKDGTEILVDGTKGEIFITDSKYSA